MARWRVKWAHTWPVLAARRHIIAPSKSSTLSYCTTTHVGFISIYHLIYAPLSTGSAKCRAGNRIKRLVKRWKLWKKLLFRICNHLASRSQTSCSPPGRSGLSWCLVMILLAGDNKYTTHNTYTTPGVRCILMTGMERVRCHIAVGCIRDNFTCSSSY